MPLYFPVLNELNISHIAWVFTHGGKIYYKVCRENNLEPTDCIMFGIGGNEWAEYNRGNETNRVCVSELIRDKYVSNMWR